MLILFADSPEDLEKEAREEKEREDRSFAEESRRKTGKKEEKTSTRELSPAMT